MLSVLTAREVWGWSRQRREKKMLGGHRQMLKYFDSPHPRG